MKPIPSKDFRQSARALPYAVGAFFTLALVIAQTTVAAARGAPESFADLAEQLSPAVVNITTSTKVTGRTRNAVPRVPEGSPFQDLFPEFFNEQQPGQPNRPRQRRSSALGSGFIISADGYVVTNNHVIDGADEILVELFSGGKLEAELIGRDEKTDIALLKVSSDNPLPFVAFGDSDVSRVGDWVMAIGNPLGQGFSVSAGIISQRGRSLRGQYDDFIQTDAAINKGNSGGPLFNMDGEVIGVNTAIISPNGGSIGLGFSMASNVVTKVVNQLQEFGETRRGWLGVRIQGVDDELADAIGLDKAVGALVSDVPPGPSADAGIQQGDVILNFDGKDVKDADNLVRIVADTEVGKAVRVVVFRDGKTQTLKVTLGRREDAERETVMPASVQPQVTEEDALGMTLKGLDAELRAQLQIEDDVKGVVVVQVNETSDAYKKGIRQGDLIAEVGTRPVASSAEVAKAFKDAREAGRKSALLLVRTGSDQRFVALSLNG